MPLHETATKKTCKHKKMKRIGKEIEKIFTVLALLWKDVQHRYFSRE